jgi:hypothetical protein
LFEVEIEFGCEYEVADGVEVGIQTMEMDAIVLVLVLVFLAVA